MKMINKDIFNLYQKIENAFSIDDRYLPAKINFYIQKNKNILYTLSLLIEDTKNNIADHYGQYQPETDSYFIEQDKREIAQQELNDLMNIEQDVNILKIKFKDIENLEFTSAQMDAILFMIQDEEQGEE